MASGSSETDYVTLISNDGFSFVVQRSAATISPMVRKMLDPQSMCFFLSPSPYLPTYQRQGTTVLIWITLGNSTGMFMEAKNNIVRFDNINGIVLEKVCEYFYYNERNRDARDVPDMDFPTELCLEILMAADYLGGV
ncbi:hypothetical protein KC316_g6184 [Hortaea werneckii]|nr:hypothetical protein KC324_g10285 [Hortaea werneckii]KAI7585432.1 hypothetical protein KC316_g6184 [Hortaea werneckii]